MASNPQPFIAAARRYGSDPGFDRWARKKYGVSGPALLAKVAKGESGFDMSAVSKAGARGGTQFMPPTRDEYVKRYGVDPWANPDEAVHATKLYLEHDKRGLAGYNPGDPSYTGYILGQKVGGLGGSKSSVASPLVKDAASTVTTTTPGVDNSGARRQAALGYFQQGGIKNTAATLALANTIAALKDVAPTTTTTRASPSTRASGGGGSKVYPGSYPLAEPGKVIGTPYTGTHTLGNWQSDNAVDIRVPVGTPMVALQAGTVVKVRHHPQDGGRFAGDQITIRGANGNEYFYAHGKASVKPGQRIRKGQSLGTTGSANGVPHLHFGQMDGDPRQHV